MNQLPTNYFNFANADSLHCKVEFFRQDHLVIQVSDSHEAICSLIFMSTYFQCPMAWVGANFRLATSEEQLTLWRTLHLNYPQNEFLQHMRLFIVEVDMETENPKTVLILAEHADTYIEGAR